MRKELHCPQIIKDGKTIGYGGDQEWFPGDFQRLAGCGSVTGSNIAAIYALSREDFKDLYPIKDSQKAADYEQYLNLMQTMYRYMKPGFMGYPLIGRFAKDFKRYAKDHGITLSSEQLFLPKSKEQALDFILPALKEDHPVAFLILRHPAHELREDNWHWVTITGFDEEEEKPQMIAGPEFHLPDEEILAKARKLLRIEDEGEKGQYLKQKLALLKLKGEKR